MFPSSEGNVWKYVFDFGDAMAEAVLYKYEDFYTRTVICCSVQSGCPVGCVFCGTGKKFIRNLTAAEIVGQVAAVLDDKGIADVGSLGRRFQIMFMSMGEPFLNMPEVLQAVRMLNAGYPSAELLISTVGINEPVMWDSFISMSTKIAKVGLQFSLHSGFDDARNAVIPFKHKFSIRDLRDHGIAWSTATGRKVYLNYCVTDTNAQDDELDRISDLFSPTMFNLTFSVVCSADETLKAAGYRNHDKIDKVMARFIEQGYNVRKFDPAGQDDIGGGCGQLFHVQRWMQRHRRTATTTEA